MNFELGKVKTDGKRSFQLGRIHYQGRTKIA